MNDPLKDAVRVDRKFAGEAVEDQKALLRLEETASEAEVCPACARARAVSGDATDLCTEHLRRVYGV